MQTWTRHDNGMVTDGGGVWVREDPNAAPFREILAAVAAGAAEVIDYQPPPPSYRELRALAYRDELGKESGDFIKTLGDVLDVLIAQTEANRTAADAAMTSEYAAMLQKIAQIKSAYPEPK